METPITVRLSLGDGDAVEVRMTVSPGGDDIWRSALDRLEDAKRELVQAITGDTDGADQAARS